MNSIIQKSKKCFICNKEYGLEKHHCIKGNANRKKSDELGLWVWLCQDHHRGTYGVHGKNGHNLDLFLKKTAQMEFEKQKERDEFIRIFGKSFLID